MGRMQPGSLWPEPSGSKGAEELAGRWSALLAKAPRLRPFVDQMLGRRRLHLQQSGIAQVEVEDALFRELSRWISEFEVLSDFAVSAIAVTLEDETLHETEPLAPETADAAGESPEKTALDLDALLADPAFALAFHCIDTCVRPALPASPPAKVPEADWFALLHAASRPNPSLTPEVAIALVLHMLSPGWQRLASAPRQAALRLFLAGDRELRGDLQRLCSALPEHWALQPAHLAEFAATAGRAKAAFAEAAALCARIVSSVRQRPGGLSLLGGGEDPRASAEDLAALFRSARKYRGLGGLRKLLSLL